MTAATKPHIELSNSSNNQIASCPRKYQIRKRFQHAASDFDDSLAAMGGRAVHVYLQTLMAGGNEQDAELAFFWEWNFQTETSDNDKNRKFRGFEANLFTAKAAAKEMVIDPDAIAKVKHEGEIVPAIECKFNIILSHPNWANDYHYRGAIDFITYYAYNDMYTVYDIKTNRRSMLNADHVYKYDTQTIPYGLVIQHATGKDLQSFTASYVDLYVDVVEPRYQVFSYPRKIDDVQRWLDHQIRMIEDIEKYHNRDAWPRSINGCVFFQKPCGFFKVCDYEEPAMLQSALLGFAEPKPPIPYGEWLTMNIDCETMSVVGRSKQ